MKLDEEKRKTQSIKKFPSRAEVVKSEKNAVSEVKVCYAMHFHQWCKLTATEILKT